MYTLVVPWSALLISIIISLYLYIVKLKEKEAGCPNLNASLKRSGRFLVLEVKNNGGQAMVRGRLSVSGDLIDNTVSGVDTVWLADMTVQERRINKEETQDILIAELSPIWGGENTHFKCNWQVKFRKDGNPCAVRSNTISILLSKHEQETKVRINIKIDVFSNPESLSPVNCTFDLVGGNIVENLQGKGVSRRIANTGIEHMVNTTKNPATKPPNE